MTRHAGPTTIIISLAFAAPAVAQFSIDPAHKFAWGENIGWTNWADANGGDQAVRLHATFLSGFIWAENVGWITVGDGTPVNGVTYANANGGDAGVNRDPTTGNLTGMAWGENIGWINFAGGGLATPPRPARFDAITNRLRGFAWGENVGWINLDHGSHYVGVIPDCYADCDTSTGRGVLDIFDFLCFGNAFATGDPYACDCDLTTGPATCDIFDFLCFGNAFSAGCP